MAPLPAVLARRMCRARCDEQAKAYSAASRSIPVTLLTFFFRICVETLGFCKKGTASVNSLDMFGQALIFLWLCVASLDGFVIPQGSKHWGNTGSAGQTSPKGSLSQPDARTEPNSSGSKGCNALAMATGVVDDKLKQLGITLPEVAPAGSYVLYRRSADTLYMSGHLPKAPDGTLTTGKVGEDVDVEQAAAAARLVAVNLITTMKAAAGDLDKIRLVKITGFVRSSDGFAGQSQVLNGASDLFLEAFGREKGEHARSAVGVNALPFGVCVEIEAIAEVAP